MKFYILDNVPTSYHIIFKLFPASQRPYGAKIKTKHLCLYVNMFFSMFPYLYIDIYIYISTSSRSTAQRPLCYGDCNSSIISLTDRSEGLHEWDMSSLGVMGWRAGGGRKSFRRCHCRRHRPLGRSAYYDIT